MEIFGVGPLEFLLVLVLALVILGPEDMVGTSRKIGQWIYRAVRSPTWRAIISTTQDLRELPQKIVRDAGIEEAMNEVKDTVNEAKTQVSEATTQVNSEMQAATREMNSEMQVATQQVSQDMQLPGSSIGVDTHTPGTYENLSSFTGANIENQTWPEQNLAKYNPPSYASGVYVPPTQQTPLYYLPLGEYTRALATGPRTAANLDGIVRAPVPPPPPLAAPELIAGALSFLAINAAPADLEVPFIFADPTDYPDPQPVIEVSPQAALESEAADEAKLAAAPSEETPSAPEQSSETPPDSSEAPLTSDQNANTDLAAAMEQRMREMDEAFLRLDATIPQENPPPTETEAPASNPSEISN